MFSRQQTPQGTLCRQKYPQLQAQVVFAGVVLGVVVIVVAGGVVFVVGGVVVVGGVFVGAVVVVGDVFIVDVVVIGFFVVVAGGVIVVVVGVVVVVYLKRLRIVLRCAKAGCGRRTSSS